MPEPCDSRYTVNERSEFTSSGTSANCSVASIKANYGTAQ